jgi:UDPglucose 6-dehydrogenase
MVNNAYEAVTGADAVVLVTEWDAFRAIDLDRVRDLAARPILIDLRNVYDPAEVREKGFHYSSVGRP